VDYIPDIGVEKSGYTFTGGLLGAKVNRVNENERRSVEARWKEEGK
jgi:hypothetical protein